MTTDKIYEAILCGHVVIVGDDIQSRICRDMFGDLVVLSLNSNEPAKLATLSDKRKARILNT